MLRREYLEIIAPYNFWGREVDTGIWRDIYVRKILRAFSIPSIVVSVTGVRRAGKTYICRQVLRRLIERGMRKEQTLYINLEDPSLQPYLSTDFLQDLYDTYRHYLNPGDETVMVLDEVQNLPGWERWVRAMMEKNEDTRIIVTGSSSKIMGVELSHILTGRYIDVRVYPLSFIEYLRFRDVSTENIDIRRREVENAFMEYLEYGGFPTVVLTKDREMRREFLKELFESIVTRDISARYSLRKIHELKSSVVILLQSISAMSSVQKVVNILKSTGVKLSPVTVNEYLHYLQESLLFQFVPIFSYKVKDHMQYPKKVYCVDTGLINAVAFRMSENLGRLAENVVAIELFHRYGDNSVFYWKDRMGREVDFVIVENRKPLQLIQVTWDVGNRRTRDREIRAILSAAEELSVDKLLILTVNTEKKLRINQRDIEMVPIWKWLLQAESR